VVDQDRARSGALGRGSQVPKGFFVHMPDGGGVAPAQPLPLARKRAHRKRAHSRQSGSISEERISGTPDTNSRWRARVEVVNILPNAGGVVR
jgi:hypothetical protein